jgi:hypothetical protein
MEKTVFKKGDRVFDIQYGWGIVTHIFEDHSFPIRVQYNHEADYYTSSGKASVNESKSILSFTEYTLQGFSQERPVDRPEIGECVMVSNDGIHWSLSTFFDYIPNDEYSYVTKNTSNEIPALWKKLIRIKHDA